MAMASEEVFEFSRKESHFTRLAGQFSQLKRDGELTDVTVECKEKTFQCHKVILAACSPFLKAMMLSGASETSKQLVTFDDIPAAVLEQLLDYMYTGVAYVSSELLLPTIKACEYLQLVELQEDCQSKAVTVVTSDNVISCYKLADSLNIDELKARCNHLLESSLAEVSKASEFLELSLAEVSGYVSDARETQVDPDDLLEATMGWVAHDLISRQDHMLALVKHIDITGCSLEQLDAQMDNHMALLAAQPAVNRFLTKGMVQVAAKDPVRRTRKKKKRQQKGQTKLVVIAGNKNMCLYLDPSMQFQKLCDIQNCPEWCSACETPAGFVLTGGEHSALCRAFVATTKSWESLAPLLISRNSHGSIVVHGKLFLLGGIISGRKSASVQSLELQSGGRWQEEAELPQPVCLPEVAGIDEELFLLDTRSTCQLFHLDVIDGKAWSRRAKFPGCCKGARMIAVHGELLVAGGKDPVFGRYTPGTDTWQTGTPPLLAHHLGALSFHEQKLYLIGGATESRVEEYDLATETWSECSVRLPWELLNHLRAVNL